MSRTAQTESSETHASGDYSARIAASASRKFLRYVEENAVHLRAKAGVRLEERLDPRSLATRFGLRIVNLNDIAGVKPGDRKHVESVDAKTWSGGCIPLPQGELLVILHPNQTPERAAVTIMEEVSHVHFGHQPSRLEKDEHGITHRKYNGQIETEAYWTAAAALLPSKAIARRVYRGINTEDIAAEFGVSAELVEFRIKILRLWSDHKKRHHAEVMSHAPL